MGARTTRCSRIAELVCGDGTTPCRKTTIGGFVKRFGSLVVVTSIVAACVVGLVGVTGVSAASVLPTLKVAVTGKTGIAVSGSTVSGAVNVTSTFSGKGQGGYGLIRLDQGVSFPEALHAVQAHHGDPNALTPFGALVVSADAPGTVQTVLTPGDYVALNLTGNGPAANVAQFTVTPSSSPAALPAAAATETSTSSASPAPRSCMTGRSCGLRTTATWCTWMC